MVNAVGDVVDDDGAVLVGIAGTGRSTPAFPDPAPFEGDGGGTNTTLVVVATNARCTKVECHLLAQSAHHGMARAIHPVAHPPRRRHRVRAARPARSTGTSIACGCMVTEVTAEAVRDAVAYHRATP